MARTAEQSELIEKAEKAGGLATRLKSAAVLYAEAEAELARTKGLRDKEIKAAAAKGLPLSWIAEQAGLAKTGVQKVLA